MKGTENVRPGSRWPVRELASHRSPTSPCSLPSLRGQCTDCLARPPSLERSTLETPRAVRTALSMGSSAIQPIESMSYTCLLLFVYILNGNDKLSAF